MRYAVRRIFAAIPTWIGVITISFFLVHLIPGDPTDLILGDRAGEIERAALREKMSLNLPLGKQYTLYLSQALRLKFGHSLYSSAPVGAQILGHFSATFELAAAAMILALVFGLPLGIFGAAWKFSFIERAQQLIGVALVSMPGVVLGPLLVYIFAIRLEWFPVSERGGLQHLFLPALSLALPLGAVLSQISRIAILEVLNEDFIRTARAKGLRPITVYLRHALRPALSPIVTVIGLQSGAVLTGTVITETIFDWPGIGTLLYSAILNRDYPLVQGLVAFIAGIYILMNLITDLIYAAVNPTVRLET